MTTEELAEYVLGHDIDDITKKCTEILSSRKEDVSAQGRRMGIYEARALFDGHPRPKFVGN